MCEGEVEVGEIDNEEIEKERWMEDNEKVDYEKTPSKESSFSEGCSEEDSDHIEKLSQVVNVDSQDVEQTMSEKEQIREEEEGGIVDRKVDKVQNKEKVSEEEHTMVFDNMEIDNWGRNDSLDKQMEDMRKLDDLFEHRAKDIAHLIDIEEIKKRDLGLVTEEMIEIQNSRVMNKDEEKMRTGEEKVDEEFKEVKAKNKSNPIVASRRSSRRTGVEGKI